MILTAWVRTMSLFHDIKLKRRKVDNHSNSDSEVNADVITSSPESLTNENHARDLDAGSASGSSTTQTYLSEDGASTASGSPPQLEVMCLDMPGQRCERDKSPPLEQNCKVKEGGEHIVNGVVESPQHERRNSVFDGGGDRSNMMEINGREGLDLRRTRRDTDGSSNSPPSFEDHSMSVVRMLSNNNPYKTPLVMGDIPGTGPGKTMMWAPSNERIFECTNSSPPNGMDILNQPSTSTPIKLSPGSSGSSHSSSPLSPLSQVSLLSPSASASTVVNPIYPTPIYSNAQCKTSLLRTPMPFSSSNSHNDSMLSFPSTSSRASYSGRDNSPVGFTRYWPTTNGLTNGEHNKTLTNKMTSSTLPRYLTDSQALNLTVNGPSKSDDEAIPGPSSSSACLSIASSGPSTSSGLAVSSANHMVGDDDDEDDQPMVCMICEDKATGLHYGIITCEGCKGFFKRTVQNKRVYTCVADGNCEITKAQRNRCQYCRFQKCLRQGMVLAAVREDRMPGGRNSGAVYNLYKVKYKKHKKGQKNGQLRQLEAPKVNNHIPITNGSASSASSSSSSNGSPLIRYAAPPPEWPSGQILKAALTSPCDIRQLRRNLESWVSNSRDRHMTPEQAMVIISQLIECDDFEDIAIISNLEELKEVKTELSDKLCQIGDTIVYKLVQWTKRLPFYLELPVTVHTQLLSHKWHELLVLTTSAYVAIRSNNNNGSPSSSRGYSGGLLNGLTRPSNEDFEHEVGMGLCALHSVLGDMVEGAISLEQIRVEAGQLVEQLTQLTATFRKLHLCLEEYVCLKVVAMLNPGKKGNLNGTKNTENNAPQRVDPQKAAFPGQREIEMIQERYLTALRVFVENRFPQQSGRMRELLSRLPEIQSAGELLLNSRMFFVPLFLNTNIFAR